MDIEFLTNGIIPQRRMEIEEGKNSATRNPIYVVLRLRTHIVSGHVDGLGMTTVSDKNHEWGYADDDLDSEDMTFELTKSGMKNPGEYTRFYTDEFIAFFLTRKGAEDYMKYQAHNLAGAFIYVFNSGYRNFEMDTLLGKE